MGKGITASLRKYLRNSKGFTLIELLIVLAILLVILVSIYNLFSYVYQSWGRVEGESLRLQEARLALDMLGSELRNALPIEENKIGVEVLDNGNKLELKVGPESGVKKVRYWLEKESLWRAIIDDGGKFEGKPEKIAELANKGNNEKPFELQGRVVKIYWKVDNTSSKRKLNPKEITAEFTIRNGLLEEED